MRKIFQIKKYIEFKSVLLIILAFLLGWQVGHKDLSLQWQNYKPTFSATSKEPPKNINLDFKLFWDTWDLLSSQYIERSAIDPKKLYYGAISGMVQAVGDPYTFFLTPEQQKSSKEELNGSFEGVGIQLGFNKNKRLVVIAPLSGTPAAQAGIKPEDIILKIEDKDTTSITLPEAVSLIRGPKGTKVALTILSGEAGEPKEYTLTRDTIIVKSVEVSFENTNSGKEVAVVKLSRFGERTKDEWNKAVTEIQLKNPSGLVLDVRNNPGGFLEGAVFIASEFLSDGIVVKHESLEQKQDFEVNKEGKLTSIPMVVLVNKGSASASEIVAGALQDHTRAQLVGEKTFGKGTIQEAQELEGGTGIHITVAKWLTPNGRWVNDTEGLEPDVIVEMDDEDKEKDRQLEKALELLE